MNVLKLLFLILTIFVCHVHTSKVWSFKTLHYNVKGDVYFKNDDTSLEIRNFYYDGRLYICRNNNTLCKTEL